MTHSSKVFPEPTAQIALTSSYVGIGFDIFVENILLIIISFFKQFKLKIEIFKKLGIDAGRDQLEQIISSDDQVINNPSFQNEAGFFDFGIFSDYISQMKIENPSAYDNWKVQENSIIGIAKQRIYLDLIKASNVMTESEAKENFHFENDNVNIHTIQSFNNTGSSNSYAKLEQ